MSFLLPHFLKEGRGKLDVYFTRVYNPVWTNPDGMTWMEVLRGRVAGRAARGADADLERDRGASPTTCCRWGTAGERHDIQSQETHSGRWVSFRQPVLRAARERMGETFRYTYEANPGEVWEEDEFWIELSLADRPGRRARHPPAASSRPTGPARSSPSTSTTAGSSRTRCPGCPEAAAREGLAPARLHAAATARS